MLMKPAIILLILISTCSLSAQMVKIPFAVKNTVGDKSTTYGMTLAADPQATVGLDTALGEREIPSLPPPAGVFVVYSIPPSEEYMWLSPIDIRPLEVGKQHLTEYTIGMTWNAGSIEVSWGQLPSLVDSAYIVDIVSDWPNNFIKVKLEQNKTYSTINTAITKLKVLVWYNATSLGVTETTNENVDIYPNPTTDVITIAGVSGGLQYHVYDIAGSLQVQGTTSDEVSSIPTSQLLPGVYSIQVADGQGWNTIRSFVKR